jgi:dihydroorotate dehydrogenase
MTYQVRIGAAEFEHPILFAAGTCKRTEDLRRLLHTSAAGGVIGSFTPQPRTGNPDTVTHWGDVYSLNSLGLPNPGLHYLEEHAQAITKLSEQHQKPVIISVAGFSDKELISMCMVAHRKATNCLIEINLGCPNVWKKGRQEKIASFDPAFIARLLVELRFRLGQTNRIGIKLSPYSDTGLLAEVAHILLESEMVTFVTTCNTFPNALALHNNGTPIISHTHGLAGMSGPAMKGIGLGQVSQFNKFFENRIKIFGVGGITTGNDVRDYLHAGANAVQIATTYLHEKSRGPTVFTDILEEYNEIIDPS